MEDSEAYVEAIMSPLPFSLAQTPCTPRGNRRKRAISETEVTEVKKAKVGEGSGTNSCSCNNSSAKESSLETILEILSADIRMQFNAMNERIDRLESGLEQKIASKVAQVFDKRITGEVNKLKKAVDDKIESVKSDIKADLSSDIEALNDTIDELVKNQSQGLSMVDDIALNVVIQGLPEQNNENTLLKVNKMLKDGLKVLVECDSAVRKKGLIVAHFKCHEDKRRVMLQKKKLYESRQYTKVFINHDQPLVVRQMANNFRTVLGALQQHGLVVRGSRVLRMDQARGNTRQDRSGSDDRRNKSFPESAHTDSNRTSGNRNSYADAAGGRGSDSHRGSQG